MTYLNTEQLDHITCHLYSYLIIHSSYSNRKVTVRVDKESRQAGCTNEGRQDWDGFKQCKKKEMSFMRHFRKQEGISEMGSGRQRR